MPNDLARLGSALLTVTTIAAASTAALAQDKPAVSSAKKQSGRQHTGWQIRAGLGGGYLRDEMEATFIWSAEGTAEGSSVGFQITAGYAVRERLFLGGGLFTDSVTDPEITFEGSSSTGDIEVGTLVLVGPYLNYYLTDNWHLLGAVGAANIRTKDDEGQVDDDTANGGGVVLQGGYDMWVANDFTLGLAARADVAGLWGDFVSHQVTAYSLLVSATYD